MLYDWANSAHSVCVVTILPIFFNTVAEFTASGESTMTTWGYATSIAMAVVALASFTQPSIELSYGIKFSRILMILGAGFFGLWGFGISVAISLIMLATTKTLSGESYLYPLFPFNLSALKRLTFRCPK